MTRLHGRLLPIACALAGMVCAPASAQPASRPAPVTVGAHHGAPALIVDGKPEFPVLIFQTVLTEKEPPALRSEGFRVFSLVGNDAVFGMSTGWVGDGQYDYRECDAALRTFAERVPDGYCIPRVLVSAPAWWLDKHPEESVRFASGVGWKDNEWGGTKHESFASRLWRQESGEALRRLVQHILESPYRDRVAGIHVAGGIYGEWHNWSAPDLPDTSEPMRQALIEHVRRKCRGDLPALRHAWRGERLTFETIRIPSADEQHTGDVGMFRDPARRRPVIDYCECLHAENFEAVEHFCRIVKAESGGRLLSMALYGYVPDLNWPQAGDHRAGARAMRSSAIDILASPHTYGRRRLGEDGLFRHFPAAAVLHGKLFLDEADDRTHLAPTNWPARYAPDMNASLQILRREFANALTRGCGLYYMDQSGTFFNDPQLIRELGRIRKWGERAMQLPRQSVADVAVISSLESGFYTTGRESGKDHVSQALYDAQIAELCRSGAPFDWYHIQDLAEKSLRPYRVYVFLDCFYLTALQRKAIERLKSDGRTLLWFYAPGFVTENSLSREALESLTGLRFEQLPEATLQVSLDSNALPGAPPACGFPVTQAPMFLPVAEPVTQVLGHHMPTGRPAFVARSFAKWRSVYCPTPVLSAAALRKLFRDAGVHIYCDSGDNLSANASWVCVHAATAGEKTIRLPRSSVVYDAINEKPLLEHGSEFSVEMQTGETGIWRVNSE